MMRAACVVAVGVTIALASASIGLTRAAPPPYSTLHWRSIGPAVAGGRVPAVAGTDADPLLYYLGGADGGVWRTDNGGVTWADVFASEPVAAIGAIAIAPQDKNDVWIGTGEANSRNDVYEGDGVWQSRDGGRHWTHRGLAGTKYIAKILIDPKNPNVVLVGALGDIYQDDEARGVYRTADGGRTWEKTLFVGPASGISDMSQNTRNPNVVFAAVWQFRRVPWSFESGGDRDGLYRSDDRGKTWRSVSGHGLPQPPLGRIGVAIAPSNPRRVYAVIQSREGFLWRSNDGGQSWHMVNSDTAIDQRPFYFGRVAVDPRHANHVFSLSEHLLESFDGGKNFREVDSAVHVDHHDMWIAADGRRMIEGNDGGAPISLDAGKTWDWRYNVVLGQVYHIGYDRTNPYHVCGGLQDNDAYCGPADSLSPLGILNGDWLDVGDDGDGSWVWPDPLDPRLVWNVGVNQLNGQLGIYDARSRENHDVSPYAADTNGRALTGLPYRFNWEAPFAFSPANPNVTYYGGNVVFRTADRGQRWQVISPDLTLNDSSHQQVAGGPINTDASGADFYDTILTIAPSPLDPGVIWVGTDDGLVQLTQDDGAHWRNVTMSGLGPYGRMETIEPSRVSPAAAFAVVDRHLSGDRAPHVFATQDFGRSWQSISANLPAGEFAHAIREDPRNHDVLYIGTSRGVWLSLDRGKRWQSLRLNLPATAVRDLQVQPDANDLVAATHGRGFWVLDDLAVLQQLRSAEPRAAHFFAPRTSFRYYRWWTHEYGTGSSECCAPQNEFAGENPPVGAMVSYYLGRAAPSRPVAEIVDSGGSVLRRLDATNHAGINRIAWDLRESAPMPWKKARQWNRGPDGPEVVPGAYVVRLRIGGAILTRPLAVKPDPRASWTQGQYIARRDFLRTLDRELSDVDSSLNALDRRAKAHPLDAPGKAIYAELTSNPRNDEDNLLRPDRLRERLVNLIDIVGLSQGPPLAAHEREAAEIRELFAASMDRYRAYLRAAAGSR